MTRPATHDRSAGNELELGDAHDVGPLAATRKPFETRPHDVINTRSTQTAPVTDYGDFQCQYPV